MRYHHPSDKDGFENSIKNNVNKALYIVSGTDWKLKKKRLVTTVVVNETMQYYSPKRMTLQER